MPRVMPHSHHRPHAPCFRTGGAAKAGLWAGGGAYCDCGAYCGCGAAAGCWAGWGSVTAGVLSVGAAQLAVSQSCGANLGSWILVEFDASLTTQMHDHGDEGPGACDALDAACLEPHAAGMCCPAT